MHQEIASQIKERIGTFTPDTLIILGSGLGALADEVQYPITIPYNQIKGFPKTTVKGHADRLICGKLQNRNVICMQGRFHIYEGHPPQIINTIISAFKLLGIKELIVTNAAGSLNLDMGPGSLMLINDHINFNGPNPLIGPNDETTGVRFPDMSEAYNLELRNKLKQIANKLKIKLFEGVYLWNVGPTFETPAEIKMFQTLGADAVGMSTVPEVICAVRSDIKVLGISAITNLGTGLRTGKNSHEETLSEGQKASLNLTRLIKEYLNQEN